VAMVNKKLKALIIGIGVLASGILYRMGGSGNYPRQARIIGVSALSTLILALLRWKIAIWLVFAYLVSFGACVGAVSTYWDFLFCNKDNFYMHGFMIGLSYITLAWFGIAWWLILIRAIILALGMGLLNKYTNKWKLKHPDIIEELGRGAIITLTLPLLLL
jgi:hypothetical protein